MPSRYVRDGLLESPQVERAGEPGEVLFVRLILVADDYGRMDGRHKVIANKCWPNGGPDEPEIERRLDALENAKNAAGVGLIVRYEVAGQPYLWIPKFGQRTRAKKSKYPDPPQVSPQAIHHVTDERPADDGQVPGNWRAPAGHPQAYSSSYSSSSRRDAGQASDTRQSKPMLPVKALTKTQQIIEESRAAKERATPPPGGSAMELLKRSTKGNGQPPPDPAPREPGEDAEEGESLDHNQLDREAATLGMQRIAFESDAELQTRITARRALG